MTTKQEKLKESESVTTMLWKKAWEMSLEDRTPAAIELFAVLSQSYHSQCLSEDIETLRKAVAELDNTLNRR